MKKHHDTVCANQVHSVAWQRLEAARDASAIWYDSQRIPPIREGIRVAIEGIFLSVVMTVELYDVALATYYLHGGKAIPPIVSRAGGLLELASLCIMGVYFGAAGVTRRFPDCHHLRWLCQKNKTGDSDEALRTALVALGGWDALGVEFSNICGVNHQGKQRLSKAIGIWTVGLFGTWFGGLLFGKILTPGGLLLGIALVFAYAFAQLVPVITTRRQARHPEKYSPCKFRPLFMLLDFLRATVEDCTE